MISIDTLPQLLAQLGFAKHGASYSKTIGTATLKVDTQAQRITYPDGLIVNGDFTCNFSSSENFVVLECVHRLLEKGYKAAHIELEQTYEKLKKSEGGGRADIIIKDNDGQVLCIIECKTAGDEFKKHWNKTLADGDQLFRYLTNKRETRYLCLYTSDWVDAKPTREYHLISLSDNETFLQSLKNAGRTPLSFAEAKQKNKEDIFLAWAETYEKDYSTKGLFEDGIAAYDIGKHKFSLEDLQTINSKDIQGKYHQFATILRQHNVSGRENAFDKLVNLFLCKIVDESRNPKELKFYWKGAAYDNHFDLQDRLQLLYKAGMKEFLGEEVTYIDNAAIDEAFRFFKNDPDATRETIKSYFRELKFFTNNDFSFVDVHNEKLFYQNAEVLLKIVRMLQDIRLKTNEANQFLGDMFEGFLDQGVKQSEGQFFTPMPIVKFILSSLPLERLVQTHEHPPQAIDYACGAGHFLNEYAKQIAPFVTKHKTADLSDYHAAIVGIEKEYRLSKVAKVSAFMYGQDNVQIFYHDALASSPKIKDASFDVLVVNPPYSVKGFLETLLPNDRSRFDLTASVEEKSYNNHNSIEAFFIERAKQLLKADGVAAIIVPSSILTNGKSSLNAKKTNVYVATREILLKYFDIVAITALGSGTFGKTGTNTVTLFLRRRKQDPAPADHYRNRVASWFNGNDNKAAVFADEHFIRNYCNRLGYAFDDYKTLLQGQPNAALLNIELFKDYHKQFNGLTETKNLLKQKNFKALSKEAQQTQLDKQLVAHVRRIEQDKLYYFVLASLNPTATVIVRSPTGNAEMKRFLGYDWSSGKGKEGIKYLGNQTVKLEKTDDEEDTPETDKDDKRVLENLLNLDAIHTPLYDPKNLASNEHLNSLIRANFNGEAFAIPDTLKEFASTARLEDMLDFSRVTFEKQIVLTVKEVAEIKSKWPVEKLGNVAEVIAGQSPESTFYNEKNEGLPFYQGKKDFGDLFLVAPTVWTTQTTKLSFRNDVLISVRAPVGNVNINPFAEICIGRGLAAIRASERLSSKFVFEYIAQNKSLFKGIQGAIFESISSADLRDKSIPLPPLDIQQQIVAECEAVDAEATAAQASIAATEGEIIARIEKLQHGSVATKTLQEICEIKRGRFTHRPRNEPRFFGGAYPFIQTGDVVRAVAAKVPYTQTLNEEGLAVSKLFQPPLVLVTIAANIGDTAVLDYPACFTDSVVGLIPSTDINARFLELMMRAQKKHLNEIAPQMAQKNINIEILKPIKVPVPPLAEQQKLVAEIEALERTIASAQAVIAAAPAKKQAIMQCYL